MKKIIFIYSIILYLIIILATDVVAETFRGMAVKVTDGDTIVVLNKYFEQIKVRLYGVDTPEKRQSFGNRAKQFTSDFVGRKIVDIKELDRDRYGRMVALVSLPNGRMLNQELITAGYAWVYRKYCRESFCPEWLRLEEKAAASKIGLWGDKNPVPPWEWRRK